MRKFPLKMIFVFIVLCLALPLEAQTGLGFDMTGSPQWAKDLRRGEIVALGSFPFAFFFSNFFIDVYRASMNGWDMRYAPWPLKSAGFVSMTQEEHLLTLGFAVGGSILIAVADHVIVRYRRHKQAQEIRNLPTGTPIIIKRSTNPEESLEEGNSIPATGN